MLIGHRQTLNFLSESMDKKTLAHALCFVGPDQVGKRAIAMHLIARAFGIDEAKLASHPDFFYLEREVDEKKGRLKKDISIAQAKTVGSFLANKSWFGGTKAVLIGVAEAVNDEAANALLKTLEESIDNNLIILLTTDETLLPATVRSRCQIINFSLVSDDEIAEGLRQMGRDENLAREAAKLSWGRPGRAIIFSTEPEAMDECRIESARLQKMMGAPFHQKLKDTEELFGDKEDAVRGRDRLKRTLEIWTMIWREALRGDSLFGQTYRPSEAVEIIDALSEARDLLGRNIHPRLLIERILLKI